MPLDPEILAFIQSHEVSAYAAAADAARRPHSCRAFGCRPCPESQALVTWVSRQAGAKLLAAIASNARLAFTVTHIRSFKTLQLKSVDAAIVPVDTADFARIAAHQDGFVRETQAIGYSEALMRAVIQVRLDELAAIRFTPAAVFGQTPGPGAGSPVTPGGGGR